MHASQSQPDVIRTDETFVVLFSKVVFQIFNSGGKRPPLPNTYTLLSPAGPPVRGFADPTHF